ncbi:MAG: ABC transporter permease, partial [Candidatus Devosia euplotis]|nr:ABC transporter permease [Candidatus Devosia euplotis]
SIAYDNGLGAIGQCLKQHAVRAGQKTLRAQPVERGKQRPAAALPIAWDPLIVYVLITLILALIGWTHLARVVRGQFMAISNEDFVMAARLAGASKYRIITRHMLPSMTSYIIAALTLAVPEMILGETALSFLGLGLRPPVVSWGVLLQDAQNLRSISLAPWLLSPGAAAPLTVLAFNFLGDGLRDAAYPYGQ